MSIIGSSANQLKLGNSETILYLAKFPNGKLKKKYYPSVSVKCYKKEENAMSLKKRILVTETGNLQYSGNNFKSRTNLTRNYIAVRNKKSGIMKLYMSDLFVCEPVVEYCGDNSSKPNNEDNFAEKVESLAKAFGSKRRKKAIESKLKYTSQKSLATSLDVTALNVGHQNVEQNSEQSAQIIPQRNVNASCSEQVYLLSDIISDAEYVLLDDLASILKTTASEDGGLKATTDYCSFVVQLSNSQMTIHEAKLLCFYNFLVTLYGLGYKDLRKKNPLRSIPEPFKTKLLEKFCVLSNDGQNKQRTMPPKMKDKVIAYSIVLALFIYKFSINIDVLKDFKAPFSKLSRIAQALGCHVKSKNTAIGISKFIELSVPLYSAEKNTFMSRKRKK